MPSHDDVLKALVDEALETDTHPDRAAILREWREQHEDKPAEGDADTPKTSKGRS